jgi:hypothetical protein
LGFHPRAGSQTDCQSCDAGAEQRSLGHLVTVYRSPGVQSRLLRCRKQNGEPGYTAESQRRREKSGKSCQKRTGARAFPGRRVQRWPRAQRKALSSAFRPAPSAASASTPQGRRGDCSFLVPRGEILFLRHDSGMQLQHFSLRPPPPLRPPPRTTRRLHFSWQRCPAFSPRLCDSAVKSCFSVTIPAKRRSYGRCPGRIPGSGQEGAVLSAAPQKTSFAPIWTCRAWR